MTTLKISIQTYRIFYLTQRLFAKHHTFSDAHADSYPHRGTKGVGGGGGGWNPSPEFLIYCSILKRLYRQWKAFDLLSKMRCILWLVALLEACYVTNNGRHLGGHLGFYRELEIRLKPREMVIFCALREN